MKLKKTETRRKTERGSGKEEMATATHRGHGTPDCKEHSDGAPLRTDFA